MKNLAAPALMLGALYVATLNCGCGAPEPTAEVLAAATQTATVGFDPHKTTAGAIADAITHAGYTATLTPDGA